MPSLHSVLEQEEYNHRTMRRVVPDDFDVDRLIRRTKELVGDFAALHTVRCASTTSSHTS